MKPENILEKIIEEKKREVAYRRMEILVRKLESFEYFKNPCRSFSKALSLSESTGIITEFKRKSPSLGWLNENANVVSVSQGYAKNGASAISILTDEKFFGGSLSDLGKARVNNIPLLRKDFIIDEYQVIESKAAGADALLLIAACLDPKEVKKLARCAHSVGLQVLLELHNEDELDAVCDDVDVIGINNRNLKTFEVDLENSIRLAALLPGMALVAESGIKNMKTVEMLRQHGFSGFLIGERFMKEIDPALAFKSFLNGN